MEYSLHKIESESSATPANPLVHQDTTSGDMASQQLRKRSSTCISSSPKSQPFLSSYGSAFLSGIFADIAQVGDDQPENGSPGFHGGTDPAAATHDNVSEQSHKKARTTASTSFGRQPKSIMALTGLVEGAISEVSSPSVVSPRPKTSTIKIQPSNDQVRELQDMAFPSLPQIPITVSSSSCSTASQQFLALRDLACWEGDEDMQDGPSYGWFVATDGDEADPAGVDAPSASMFLPDTKRDLAFKGVAAATDGDQDLEVQQALAADTIDDVLGDLF